MSNVLNFFKFTAKCFGTSSITTTHFFRLLLNIYNLALIFLFGAEAIWIHYWKQSSKMFQMYIMTQILDIGVIYVTCAQHVTGILPTLRGKSGFYTHLILITGYVDKLLNYKGISKWENIKEILIAIFSIVITLSLNLTGVYALILYGNFNVYKYFVVTYINRMIIFLMLYEMIAIVIEVIRRFEAMNKQLFKVVYEGTTSRNVLIKQRALKEVDTLMKVHITLCELIEKFNKQFGYRILLMLVYVCLLLLQSIELFLNHFHSFEGKYSMSIIIDIVISVHFMVFCVCLAHYCERNYRETKKSGPLIYKLLLKTLPDSDNGNILDTLLRDDLIILAEQTVDRNVEITAAGFFPINYSLIYGMAGTILSYLVIIIQLKQQFNKKV